MAAMGIALKSRVFVMAAAAGCLMPVLPSCSGGVSRKEYVDAWIVASLRAFEKDTPVRSELLAVYRMLGRDEDDWKRAEAEWFSEETASEVNAGMQALLRARGDMGRTKYVLFRAAAYARSRARKRDFNEETAALCRQWDVNPASFKAAERIWAGDSETDGEILARIERYYAAVTAVPLERYVGMESGARKKAGGDNAAADAERRKACKDEGIDFADFEAVSQLWRGDEAVSAEIAAASG